MDIFPGKVAGMKALTMHKGGSDINCRPVQFRKMIEAHNTSEVKFHDSKIVGENRV